MAIPIAIVGVGKIAQDQHIPTILADPRFRLVGAVSRQAPDIGVPVCASLAELKAAVPDLAAIAVCTPPVDRLALLEEALGLGLDVLMEKPPARTLSEAEQFAAAADAAGRVLFQTWHSRFAGAVEPARQWLAARTIQGARIDWLEDVRVWHPGQEWIWDAGVGVFDPGINALSILTAIFPSVLTVKASRLSFPANRASPIAAELGIVSDAGPAIAVRFSFDQRGPQTWTITVDTAQGQLALLDGGARWTIDGVEQPLADDRPEYARLYAHFADLVERRASEVDLRPFRLVADAFLLATREEVGAFAWDS